MLAAVFALLFSGWLMWHTFSYDPSGFFLISGHVWSDFGAALPLIRSFTYGSNWPPQHPLYPGLPIQYHFLFYLLVGLLERSGIRIDFALNLLSGVGFALLIFLIYKFSSKLFNSIWIGLLSIIFFLFNGSFSVLDYLQKYSLSYLPQLKNLVSFAPWNDSIITAFWNLNIYTNQRHLGLSFGIAVLIIYSLVFPSKKTLFTGFLLGLLYFTNQAAFAIALLFTGWYFLINKNIRKYLLFSVLGFLPYLPFLKYLSFPVSSVHTQFGWLMRSPYTLSNFIHFWLYNIGLHLFLIPLGILFAPKTAKLLAIPLFVLFFIPNFFQLSIDLINNHKFFNFFLIIGVMFSSYFIIHISRIKLLRIFVPIILLSCTAGGIVDFFPIYNDSRISLPDLRQNPLASFFYEHTPPDSLVLNSNWFYHPASLAGRKIFNGYSYFTWSYGYDQVSREQLTSEIYASPDKLVACQLLINNNISYVELNSHPENFLHPNYSLWKNKFVPVYDSKDSVVYSVKDNCI